MKYISLKFLLLIYEVKIGRGIFCCYYNEKQKLNVYLSVSILFSYRTQQIITKCYQFTFIPWNLHNKNHYDKITDISIVIW